MNVLAMIPGHIATTAILHKPLEYLDSLGEINLRIIMENQMTVEELQWCDVVVMCRNTDPFFAPLYETIYRLKIPFVYELDDNLFAVPPNSPVARFHMHPKVRQQLAWLLRRASLLRVYSTELKNMLHTYNNSIQYVLPAVNWELAPPELPELRTNPIEIVYPSSGLHGIAMLRSLLPDIEAVLEEYGERVHLNVMGFEIPELHGKPQVSFVAKEDYHTFFEKFTRHGYTIGLAPIFNGTFYRCKSNNKFREFAAAGVVGIYADYPVYSTSVQHEETGLLISGNPGSWQAAIRQLIEQPDLLRRIRQQAYSYVKNEYNVEDVAATWLEHLQALPSWEKVHPATDLTLFGEMLDLDEDLPRILVILPGHIPSTTINVAKPLQYLEERGLIELSIKLEKEVELAEILQADIIVATRNMESFFRPLFELARRVGIPIIYDLDDNLLDTPLAVGDYDFYHNPERQDFLRWLLTNAYRVRVHSPVLKEIVEKYNPRVTRVKAPIDWRLVPNTLPELTYDPIDIVYATSRIYEDPIFVQIEKEIEQIVQHFGNRVRVHMLGFMPEHFKQYEQVVFRPYDYDYERFLSEFTSFGYAIGLAPMQEDLFYQCKTNTKFRDYAAAGAAGVYTDCPLYRDCVKHGETGFLVPNAPGEWFKAIKTLVEDVSLIEKIRQQANAKARIEHNQEDFADGWLQHLEQTPVLPRFPDGIESTTEDIANIWVTYKDDPTNPEASLQLGPSQHSADKTPLEQDNKRKRKTFIKEMLVNPAVPSLPIRQEFVYSIEVPTDNWTGLEVFVGTHQQPASGRLVLEIHSSLPGLIRESRALLDGHPDNSWLSFTFAPIVNAKAKRFMLHFYLQNTNANTLVSLYQSRPPTRRERQTYRLRRRLVTNAGLHCQLIFAK
jgi:glycosyltransferase involved in cell wall biosynthesis